MVVVEDLKIINEALSKGDDVTIQNTKNGYRIIAKKVKVLKKTDIKPEMNYDFQGEKFKRKV